MGLGSLLRWLPQGNGPKPTHVEAAVEAGESAEPPRANPAVDELADLAETFRWTVHRLQALHREAEEAHSQALRVEAEKKEFYAGVIRVVTHGKLDLLDSDPVPVLGERVAEVSVTDTAGYAAARVAITQAADIAGMNEDRADDLLIAAGEAITNAFKHAVNGCCTVYRSAESVYVRVSDEGAGISTHDLPNVLLLEGFSTKVSLGLGYSLMLRLCDHLWLSTTPSGTTVQLEMRITAAPVDAAPAQLLPKLAAPPHKPAPKLAAAGSGRELQP